MATKPKRKIIHIDMDCFYAAVEMRDCPDYRDIPLAVGGQPNQRGVIATCNYLAREYGVHSAMSSARAKILCPKLKIIPAHFAKYKEISQGIRDIFYQYTDLVEPLSLDEAFLDVSQCEQHHGSATLIANAIRKQIEEQFSLTASAGVAPNKFLAKIASDWKKPNGIFVITPEEIDTFVKTLPVKKIFGVGKVTAHKLAELGVTTCEEAQSFSKEELQHYFSRFGERLYDLCRGIDDRDVNITRQRKSISVEETYPADLPDFAAIEKQLPDLVQELEKRFTPLKTKYEISGVFVKLKFHDFVQTTAEQKTNQLSMSTLLQLCLDAYQRGKRPVRLIGVGYRLRPVDDDIPCQQMSFNFDNN